jgi:branched-chain amino acid transport system permease protein
MFLLEMVTRGLAIGAVYALMGLGLTLIFGVMRVINFAQGDFYMLGAYLAFYFITSVGLPWPIAMVASMTVLFAVGCVVEWMLLSPIHSESRPLERSMEYALIVTFALSLFLQKSAILAFGPYFKRPPDYWRVALNLPYLHLDGNLIVTIVVAAVLIFATAAYVSRTWRGRGWRATAQDVRGAKLVGVHVALEARLAFGLACALAAAAGAAVAPEFLLSPTMGNTALIKGYEIIAIGGLGSIPGSLAGGLLLGVAENVGVVYIGGAYRELIGFALLVLFLVFRPSGLFGEKG